ncbi:MAG TPA: DUF2127 domain-containing protein [Candidatus Angelobacter sp.]|nr:DUF2127 domain-containing protein [Candidatus Angelobacter sp.]
MSPHNTSFFVRHFGLRGVALFEALKGGLAVAGAIWVTTLRHKDLLEVAEHMLRTVHVAPDRHIARAFMHFAEKINGRDLRIVVVLVLIYAAIRFTEATGLWLEKEWAEWFALVSGGVYIPYEIAEVVRHHNRTTWAILIVNILIVIYMAWLLFDSYKTRRVARRQGVPAD